MPGFIMLNGDDARDGSDALAVNRERIGTVRFWTDDNGTPEGAAYAYIRWKDSEQGELITGIMARALRKAIEAEGGRAEAGNVSPPRGGDVVTYRPGEAMAGDLYGALFVLGQAAAKLGDRAALEAVEGVRLALGLGPQAETTAEGDRGEMESVPDDGGGKTACPRPGARA